MSHFMKVQKCQERLSKFQNVWLNIFGHNSDIRENTSFVSARKYELFNCAKYKSRKNKRCAKFDGIKVSWSMGFFQ